MLVSLGPDRDPAPAVAAVTDGAAVAPTSTRAAPSPPRPAPRRSPPPPRPRRRPSRATDPGALPQTDERPAASGATFTAGVQGLWQAMQQDRPELAMPFFFPQAAYLQVKAISDPATDYEHRLIANYEQDIHTLHAQLGADAAGAQFASIDVPDAQAVLVQPGEESNRLSYWRVYGTTLHYTEDGQARIVPGDVADLVAGRVVRRAPRRHPLISRSRRSDRPGRSEGFAGIDHCAYVELPQENVSVTFLSSTKTVRRTDRLRSRDVLQRQTEQREQSGVDEGPDGADAAGVDINDVDREGGRWASGLFRDVDRDRRRPFALHWDVSRWSREASTSD